MQSKSFFETEDTYKTAEFVRGSVVKLYKEGTELSFPCIVLKPQGELEMFRVEVMKGFLTGRSMLEQGDMYRVYVDIDDSLVGIGAIPNTRLKAILTSKVFASFDKQAHLDENTTLSGDMLFALCVASGVE